VGTDLPPTKECAGPSSLSHCHTQLNSLRSSVALTLTRALVLQFIYDAAASRCFVVASHRHGCYPPHPPPSTLHPTPYTRRPTPCALNPSTAHLQPPTPNPPPHTRHPTPDILHPTPNTRRPTQADAKKAAKAALAPPEAAAGADAGEKKGEKEGGKKVNAQVARMQEIKKRLKEEEDRIQVRIPYF